MILVTGATGTVGTEVVKVLASKGEHVRAMVRDPEKAASTLGQGVEIVQGDFGNPETFDAALKDVEKVFLLSPPSPQMGEQQGKFVEAAKQAGVQQIVRLSILPADPNSPIAIGRWHGEADQHVIDSGIAYTLLRPAYFMQNQLMSATTIGSQGAIYGMLGGGKVGHIDARDVSEVAAAVLTSEGHEGKIYPLTGSESLSMTEVVARLSSVLNKEVRYVDVTPEQVKAAITGMGAPEFMADGLVELDAMISEGKADMVTPMVNAILGREPRSLDQFAKDFATELQGM